MADSGAGPFVRPNDDRSAYRTLLVFTLMLVTLPIASYFVAKHMIFEGLFLMSARKSYIFSAGTAIVVVHLIVAAFIYVAWNEGSDRTNTIQFKQD